MNGNRPMPTSLRLPSSPEWFFVEVICEDRRGSEKIIVDLQRKVVPFSPRRLENNPPDQFPSMLLDLGLALPREAVLDEADNGEYVPDSGKWTHYEVRQAWRRSRPDSEATSYGFEFERRRQVRVVAKCGVVVVPIVDTQHGMFDVGNFARTERFYRNDAFVQNRRLLWKADGQSTKHLRATAFPQGWDSVNVDFIEEELEDVRSASITCTTARGNSRHYSSPAGPIV